MNKKYAIGGILALVVVIALAAVLLVPAKYDVNVTVTTSDAGTVTGDGTYSEGEQVTLEATANYGYTFSHWEEDGVTLSYNPTYTFTLDSDRDIEAVFERMLFTISTGQNYSGGSVSGGGSYYYLDSATLNATVSSGYEFDGWYVDGTKVSSSTSYTFMVTGSETVSARYSIVHDASFRLTTADPYVGDRVSFQSVYSVEIASVTWTVTDIYEGGEPSYSSRGYSNLSYYFTLNDPAYVRLTRTVTYTDGISDTKSMDVIVDGQETRTLSWRYQSTDEWYSFITNFLKLNDKSSSIDLDLSFEWYANYRSDTVYRGLSDNVYDYVTVNDPVIQSIVSYLRDVTSGMSDIERANCVLKLVQSIPYAYDSDTRGQGEFFKYPAETLWDMNGDCEDHAILYATLMEALGYDTVLYYVYCYENGVLVSAHLAPGLAVSGASGTYLTYQGVRYYYCEATSEVGTSWITLAEVGYKPSGYEVIAIYYEGGHVNV